MFQHAVNHVCFQLWLWAVGVDPRATEIVSSISALAWVVVAILGPGLDELTQYGTALSIAPEWAWIALVAASGIGQGAALVCSRWRTRRTVALCSAGCWGLIAGAAAASGQPAPAVGVYATLAIANAWAAAQILYSFRP